MHHLYHSNLCDAKPFDISHTSLHVVNSDKSCVHQNYARHDHRHPKPLKNKLNKNIYPNIERFNYQSKKQQVLSTPLNQPRDAGCLLSPKQNPSKNINYEIRHHQKKISAHKHKHQAGSTIISDIIEQEPELLELKQISNPPPFFGQMSFSSEMKVTSSSRSHPVTPDSKDSSVIPPFFRQRSSHQVKRRRKKRYSPRQSRVMIRSRSQVLCDDDIWEEKVGVSPQTGLFQSLFQSRKTGVIIRDEPPTGASRVIYITDSLISKKMKRNVTSPLANLPSSPISHLTQQHQSVSSQISMNNGVEKEMRLVQNQLLLAERETEKSKNEYIQKKRMLPKTENHHETNYVSRLSDITPLVVKTQILIKNNEKRNKQRQNQCCKLKNHTRNIILRRPIIIDLITSDDTSCLSDSSSIDYNNSLDGINEKNEVRRLENGYNIIQDVEDGENEERIQEFVLNKDDQNEESIDKELTNLSFNELEFKLHSYRSEANKAHIQWENITSTREKMIVEKTTVKNLCKDMINLISRL